MKPITTKALFIAALLALATVAGAQIKTSGPESGSSQKPQAAPQPDKTMDCGGQEAIDYGMATGSRGTAITGSCQTTVSQTPIPCNNATVTWGPGNACSAAITNTGHGSTRTASSTATKYAGTATFQCVNGIYYQTGSPSCAYVPSDCPTQSVSWTATGFTCSANALTTSHGVTRTVNNTAANRAGSAQYLCDDGSLNYVTGTCDQTDKPCTAQTFQWSVNGFNCSGSMNSDVAHLTTVTTSVPAGQPTTGSITHQCTNGTMVQRSPAPTCQASNVAAVCKSYPSASGYPTQPGTDFGSGCDAGGSYTDTTDTNNDWRWRCNGVGGGANANCTALKVSEPGQCGSFPGDYSSQPANATNGCLIGAYSDTTDTATRWRWNCIGPRSGGTTACEAVVSVVNPVCRSYTGTHAAQPATDNPTACSTGAYLDIGDTGTEWRWQCTGQGGASPVNCAATKAPVNGECRPHPGTHNTTPATSLATACVAGGSYLNRPTTNTHYEWVCNGSAGGANSPVCQAQRTSVNGSCTTLAGTYSTDPSSCDAGTVIDRSSTSTSWSWKCQGIGTGTTSSCTAAKPDPNPACINYPDAYDARPATNTATGCSSGTYSLLANTATHWNWRCTGPSGTSPVDCAARRSTYDGVCKAYSGTYSSSPATSLSTGCDKATGFATLAETQSEWRWRCNGQNGGLNTTCSALKPPANGVCGPAAKTYTQSSTAFSGNLCDVGSTISTTSTAAVSPAFPSQGSSTSWRCSGINGGNPSQNCVATRESQNATPTCNRFF